MKKIRSRHGFYAFESITMRRIYAQFTREEHPGKGHCCCCGNSWMKVNPKSLRYSSDSGYLPICDLCFNDESILYEDLMVYYTNYPFKKNGLNEKEKEYILNSLLKECENNKILKKKRDEYLVRIRDGKIESVLEQTSR